MVLPIHKNRTNFEHNDLLVPWKTSVPDTERDSTTVDREFASHEHSRIKEITQTPQNERTKTLNRFYHVFEEGELEQLILSVPKLVIEKSYYDQGNWCVIFKKAE